MPSNIPSGVQRKSVPDERLRRSSIVANRSQRGVPRLSASDADYFRNAGIFSPAIMCSKVSRALTSSKPLPFTRTSAGMARVL